MICRHYVTTRPWLSTSVLEIFTRVNRAGHGGGNKRRAVLFQFLDPVPVKERFAPPFLILPLQQRDYVAAFFFNQLDYVFHVVLDTLR
jgi:hypothetical protein